MFDTECKRQRKRLQRPESAHFQVARKRVQFEEDLRSCKHEFNTKNLETGWARPGLVNTVRS